MRKRVCNLTTPPSAGPWRPAVGSWCSFYYEGGHGERYWSGGWHCGIIREIPIKGQHKNWMRIEIMVDHYAVEETKGVRVRRIVPHEKPWVFGANVNELGDTTYHGPRLKEVVQARADEKAEQQGRANESRLRKRAPRESPSRRSPSRRQEQSSKSQRAA